MICALAAPAGADTFCGAPFDATTKKITCKDHAVSDLRPLAAATALEELDVSSTRVADLAPLAKLAHLKMLDLVDTPVADLSPLANLPELADLSLRAGVTTLVDLSLADTQVKDVRGLAKLTALQQLDLRNTRVPKADARALAKQAAHVYWGNDKDGYEHFTK